MIPSSDSIAGALLGGAVADAIALPREGLSASRALRLFGPAPLRHQFFLGRGMFSDDTEHACMTAQSLLASQFKSAAFSRSLGWRLRLWLLGAPAAVGLATLKSILKLWIGFPPSKSGVDSAGNGPAMRAAIIGVMCDNVEQIKELIHASTIITHRHPAAGQGALAVALCARIGSLSGIKAITFEMFADQVLAHITDPALLAAFLKMDECLARGHDVGQYAHEMGWKRGASGYIAQSVPAAIYAWLASPRDYRRVVESITLLGGDTDSNAAIAGALVGATTGPRSIPPEWITGIIDLPRSTPWINRLANQLARVKSGDQSACKPLPIFWPAILVRNLFFLAWVLLHGLRRLLPPY